MTHELESPRMWTKVLGALAVGAVAMYTLDPDKGRRRRAIARDKARSFLIDTRDVVGVTRRDVAHRMDGIQARVRRLFRRRPAPDDLQLIERVRARMGRLVSHPHAIQVGAYRGAVTLSGPILEHEVAPLLDSIRTVWGVSDVEDRLVVYEHPETIPSLQGGIEPRRKRSVVLQENWPPALRAAALVGGTLLALYGTQQRSLRGCAFTAAGLGLAARGATNEPLNRLLDRIFDTFAVDSERGVASADARAAGDAARSSGRGPSIYDALPPEQSAGSALH